MRLIAFEPSGDALCRLRRPRQKCVSQLLIKSVRTVERLCCTNRVRDSSRESSMVAVMHEQTYTPNLQDQELASL